MRVITLGQRVHKIGWVVEVMVHVLMMVMMGCVGHERLRFNTGMMVVVHHLVIVIDQLWLRG